MLRLISTVKNSPSLDGVLPGTSLATLTLEVPGVPGRVGARIQGGEYLVALDTVTGHEELSTPDMNVAIEALYRFVATLRQSPKGSG